MTISSKFNLSNLLFVAIFLSFFLFQGINSPIYACPGDRKCTCRENEYCKGDSYTMVAPCCDSSDKLIGWEDCDYRSNCNCDITDRCAGGSDDGNVSYIDVGGKIIDESTNLGIPDVEVRFKDNRENYFGPVYTDNNGNFILVKKIISTYDYSVRPINPLSGYGQPYTTNNTQSGRHPSCSGGTKINQPLNSTSYECQTAYLDQGLIGCGLSCNFKYMPQIMSTPTPSPTPTTPISIPNLRTVSGRIVDGSTGEGLSGILVRIGDAFEEKTTEMTDSNGYFIALNAIQDDYSYYIRPANPCKIDYSSPKTTNDTQSGMHPNCPGGSYANQPLDSISYECQLPDTGCEDACNFKCDPAPNIPTSTPTPASPYYFQVFGGDIHALFSNGSPVKSLIPPPPPKIFLGNISSIQPESAGIFSTQSNYSLDAESWFGVGNKLSPTNWYSNQYSYSTTRIYDYSHFYTILTSRQPVPGGSATLDGNSFSGTGISLPSLSNIWEISGDLTINNISPNLGVQIFLVSQDIKIDNDIKSVDTVGTYPVFITPNKVIINPDNVSQIKGIFITKYFDTGTVTSGTEKKLILNGGSVIAANDPGLGNYNIILNRKYSTNGEPAETFIYDPTYLIVLSKYLGTTTHLWQEVGP